MNACLCHCERAVMMALLLFAHLGLCHKSAGLPANKIESSTCAALDGHVLCLTANFPPASISVAELVSLEYDMESWATPQIIKSFRHDLLPLQARCRATLSRTRDLRDSQSSHPFHKEAHQQAARMKSCMILLKHCKLLIPRKRSVSIDAHFATRYLYEVCSCQLMGDHDMLAYVVPHKPCT